MIKEDSGFRTPCISYFEKWHFCRET